MTDEAPKPEAPGKQKQAAALAIIAGGAALIYSLVTGQELHTCPECPPCEAVTVVIEPVAEPPLPPVVPPQPAL